MTTPGMQGEVLPESMGKTASSAVESPPDAKPVTSAITRNTEDQNRLKPCSGKPFDLWNELELESQKGNSRAKNQIGRYPARRWPIGGPLGNPAQGD